LRVGTFYIILVPRIFRMDGEKREPLGIKELGLGAEIEDCLIPSWCYDEPLGEGRDAVVTLRLPDGNVLPFLRRYEEGVTVSLYKARDSNCLILSSRYSRSPEEKELAYSRLKSAVLDAYQTAKTS
jgi:hypothetical protein